MVDYISKEVCAERLARLQRLEKEVNDIRSKIDEKFDSLNKILFSILGGLVANLILTLIKILHLH